MANSYLAPYLRGFECAAKGGRGVSAARRIAPGTLLVVWGGNVLTGDDWQRPELVTRYSGHFSPYLQRRIAASAHGFSGKAAGRGTRQGSPAAATGSLELHLNYKEI